MFSDRENSLKITSPKIPRQLALLDDLSVIFSAGEDDMQGVAIEDGVFQNVQLSSFSVTDSRVIKTNFAEITIPSFGVKNVEFIHCDMTMARFADASWHVAEMRNSRCSGMQLDAAHLQNVRFIDCKLDLVNFRFAKLANVVFESCVVREMDFYGATLKNVVFVDCEIDAVGFAGAKLQNVDLTNAQLTNIKNVTSLKGATISDEQLIYLAPQLATANGIKISDGL